jgi:hypothetical protein
MRGNIDNLRSLLVTIVVLAVLCLITTSEGGGNAIAKKGEGKWKVALNATRKLDLPRFSHLAWLSLISRWTS